MKRITLMICTATFFFASCSNETKDNTSSSTTDSSSTAGADKKADESTTKPFTPIDSATAMKNWMAYATPGPVHAMLAKSNGTWSVTTTMWMTEGAPPMTSTGTAVNKMIMGGRYQVSNFSGNMMGQPFEGVSTLAYDNAKKVFINTWIDNAGTGLATMEGTWDEATKTVHFKGKMVNPEAGDGSEHTIRQDFTMVDDNNQVLTMWGPDHATGKEIKVMEIKYTRKK